MSESTPYDDELQYVKVKREPIIQYVERAFTLREMRQITQDRDARLGQFDDDEWVEKHFIWGLGGIRDQSAFDASPYVRDLMLDKEYMPTRGSPEWLKSINDKMIADIRRRRGYLRAAASIVLYAASHGNYDDAWLEWLDNNPWPCTLSKHCSWTTIEQMHHATQEEIRAWVQPQWRRNGRFWHAYQSGHHVIWNQSQAKMAFDEWGDEAWSYADEWIEEHYGDDQNLLKMMADSSVTSAAGMRYCVMGAAYHYAAYDIYTRIIRTSED